VSAGTRSAPAWLPHLWEGSSEPVSAASHAERSRAADRVHSPRRPRGRPTASRGSRSGASRSRRGCADWRAIQLGLHAPWRQLGARRDWEVADRGGRSPGDSLGGDGSSPVDARGNRARGASDAPASSSITAPPGPRLRTGTSPTRLSRPQHSCTCPQSTSRGRRCWIARSTAALPSPPSTCPFGGECTSSTAPGGRPVSMRSACCSVRSKLQSHGVTGTPPTEPEERHVVDLRDLAVEHSGRRPAGTCRAQCAVGLVVARHQQRRPIDRAQDVDHALKPVVHRREVADPGDDVDLRRALGQRPAGAFVAVQVAERQDPHGRDPTPERSRAHWPPRVV
jgi:hypothetical protein